MTDLLRIYQDENKRAQSSVRCCVLFRSTHADRPVRMARSYYYATKRCGAFIVGDGVEQGFFGEKGQDAVVEWTKIGSQRSVQGKFFGEPNVESAKKKSRRRKRIIGEDPEFEVNSGTVLDRVHAVIMLQESDRASELRILINAE